MTTNNTRSDRDSTQSDEDNPKQYDVVIVGGGPAGCAVGIFTARSGLETHILDRGPSSIHHCAYLENYLGFPAGIDIETFCALARDHARRAGCTTTADAAAAVKRRDEGFRIETEDGRTFRAGRVVAATKYEQGYLRPLGEAAAMFESYERDGERRERFDDSYPEPDGTTPIDGLYVAGAAAAVPDQVLASAGHGVRVGRRIRADARRERGYWEDAADRVDWVRKDRPGNEWSEPDRWREWFRERAPDDTGEDDRVLDELVEETLDTYRSREEVKADTRVGHRVLAEQLDDEAILAAVDPETLREHAARLSRTESEE